MVLAGAMLAGAGTPPLEPCLRVLWPDVVGPERLERAYAVDSAAQEMVFVAGPLVVAGLGVLAVIAALLVIGLLSSDDDDGGEQQASEATETQPPRQRTERDRPPPRPKRVVLRITPVTETYICIDTGPDTETRFEGIIDAPQTYRGKRLRVNLGNTSVEMTRNGKPFPIEASSEPAGFAFTARSSRALPLGERPCA